MLNGYLDHFLHDALYRDFKFVNLWHCDGLLDEFLNGDLPFSDGRDTGKDGCWGGGENRTVSWVVWMPKLWFFGGNHRTHLEIPVCVANLQNLRLFKNAKKHYLGT